MYRIVPLLLAAVSAGWILCESSFGSPIYRDVVLADFPVGYWRLGESSDELVVADEVSPGHQGVYSRTSVERGVPGAIADDFDTAAHFSVNGSATLHLQLAK